MRILSKFHDYYDSALAFGSDPDAIYQRASRPIMGRGLAGLDEDSLPWNAKQKQGGSVGLRKLLVFDSKDPNAGTHYYQPPSTPHLTLSEAFIVLAGKAKPVWLLHDRMLRENAVGGFTEEWAGTPTIEDAVRRVQTLFAGKLNGVELDTRQYHRISRLEKSQTARAYDESRARFMDQDFTDLHLATGAPVLLIASQEAFSHVESPDLKKSIEQERGAGRGTPPILILNPRLANLNLAQLIDPASVFQAISQFISGVVPGRQMPMVQLSDTDMVRKKGFDPKYGFRRRPAP